MTETVLHTKGLTKRYGSHTAVDRAELTVEKGQIYGLVGRNGAGKTTIIRMVTGQTIPTAGEISLFGAAGKELMKVRARTGVMVETPSSLGMKQRLGLALALMNRPDFLLLDEPINGLDPEGIVEFRNLLLKLNRERQTTILISSHILPELANLATCYGFIDNGVMLEQITARALEEKCRACIEIQVEDPSAAALILERQLGTRDYEVLSGGILRLYLSRADGAPVIRIGTREIAFAADGSGAALRGFGDETNINFSRKLSFEGAVLEVYCMGGELEVSFRNAGEPLSILEKAEISVPAVPERAVWQLGAEGGTVAVEKICFYNLDSTATIAPRNFDPEKDVTQAWVVKPSLQGDGNTGLVIGLSVGGGVLVAGAAVVTVLAIRKKKGKQA